MESEVPQGLGGENLLPQRLPGQQGSVREKASSNSGVLQVDTLQTD